MTPSLVTHTSHTYHTPFRPLSSLSVNNSEGKEESGTVTEIVHSTNNHIHECKGEYIQWWTI